MDRLVPENFHLSGFSRLTREERIQKLESLGLLSSDDAERLRMNESLRADLGENFIENMIGWFQIPLGVATNFRIDGRDYAVPMAVEETSIIAAASRTAKWIKEDGETTTESHGVHVIGQIQIGRVFDPEGVRASILKHKTELLEKANRAAQGLVRRGGGVQDVEVRILNRPGNDGWMVVLHLLADPCDAMGANIINQVCEAVRADVEEWTGEKVTMCILSNLVDTRLTRATVRIRNIDPELGRGIEEASLFAETDPYRATTNNKGVLNGMDAVILATGNDWRAVEAGVHAYAARGGRYTSITKWRVEGQDLVGRLEAPVIVGTVGGVTKLHPTARMALKMLNVESSAHLSRLIAAVGLTQNLGALRALSTVGIVEGHMKLHTANLALAAGAQLSEVAIVRQALEELLKQKKKISLSEAQDVLEAHRRGPALSPR